jgi:hypothetical protein
MKRIHGPCGRTKEQAVADFARFYQALPPQDLAIFSDGSKTSVQGTAIGFMAGRQILCGSFSLGRDKEVYDAEAEAALAGLRPYSLAPLSSTLRTSSSALASRAPISFVNVNNLKLILILIVDGNGSRGVGGPLQYIFPFLGVPFPTRAALYMRYVP